MVAGIEEYNQPASIIGNVNISAPNVGDSHIATLGDFGALGMLYNGANWDRARGNMVVPLIASADRTVQVVTPVQTNYNARGVMLHLKVNLVGTGAIYVTIYDDSNNVPLILASGYAITGVGRFGFFVYPNCNVLAGSGQVVLAIPFSLSRLWHVYISPTDSSIWNYELEASYVL